MVDAEVPFRKVTGFLVSRCRPHMVNAGVPLHRRVAGYPVYLCRLQMVGVEFPLRRKDAGSVVSRCTLQMVGSEAPMARRIPVFGRKEGTVTIFSFFPFLFFMKAEVYVPPTCRQTSVRLHGVTSQKRAVHGYHHENLRSQVTSTFPIYSMFPTSTVALSSMYCDTHTCDPPCLHYRKSQVNFLCSQLISSLLYTF
jgi:hypothetical protein